ncbi:MAG: hypothetical protein E6I93_10030 [Chloroflexi bacterium]|nr:MAG: hypothetical protein E6I93_10030 [Chloroflexota bacterium]
MAWSLFWHGSSGPAAPIRADISWASTRPNARAAAGWRCTTAPAEELALWQRMNIYDARAMLGLYCYRAGYYPAALAQWTRIPEKNRMLRPDIAHLLEELDARLALEKQETQPIRRDQILRQEPVIMGNLAPADLPNPHEPVRSEETIDRRVR